MAELSRCRACGRELAPRAVICSNCAAPVQIEIAPSPAPETVPIALAPPVPDPAPPAPRDTVTGVVVRIQDRALTALAEGTAVELGRESTVGEIAAALLPYPGVSRRHARLSLSAGRLTVTDLGSTNGTFVDDQELAGTVSVPLDHPVRVRLGKQAVLEVRRA